MHVHVHAREAALGAGQFEAELAFELERNRRLFQLARHNGYSTETIDRGDSRWWIVPPELEPIAGCMAARI